MEMRRLPILQRLPCDDEGLYLEWREVFTEELEEMLALLSQESTHVSDAQSSWESVLWLVREDDAKFGINGMNKFVFVISCVGRIIIIESSHLFIFLLFNLFVYIIYYK